MRYKKQIASFVGKTPLWYIGELTKKRPRILFYHGVIDEPYKDVRIQANQILFEDFREQMFFLKKYFQFISINEFYERFINHERFTGKEIVLTFDDGYKNNLKVAAPLLDELKIPFTIFVSTGIVDKESFVSTYYVRSAIFSSAVETLDIPSIKRKFVLSNDINRANAEREIMNYVKTLNEIQVESIIDDIENCIDVAIREEIDNKFESERMLSWSEVETLHDSGVTIGSHCVSHCILHRNQFLEIIENQLLDSKKKVTSYLGECNYFAFPNGNRHSVCDDSLLWANKIYKMSFAANGKSVGADEQVSFISRIGAAPTLSLLKIQLSLLA